jgi:hypothetical protein
MKLAWLPVLAFTCLAAQAADHLNLEAGLPTQIEDAYPIAYRGREIQSAFRYDRTRGHENRLLLEPRLEYGLAPNTEVGVSAPFYVGNADRTGSGDVHVEALYNFNTEGLVLPAFALQVAGEIPDGQRNARI